MNNQIRKIDKLYNYAIRRGYHIPEHYHTYDNPTMPSYFETFLSTAFGKPVNKITRKDLDWLLDNSKDD